MLGFMWVSEVLIIFLDNVFKFRSKITFQTDSVSLEWDFIKRKYHYETLPSFLHLPFLLTSCLPALGSPEGLPLPLELQVELMSSSCHSDSAEPLPGAAGEMAQPV